VPKNGESLAIAENSLQSDLSDAATPDFGFKQPREVLASTVGGTKALGSFPWIKKSISYHCNRNSILRGGSKFLFRVRGLARVHSSALIGLFLL